MTIHCTILPPDTCPEYFHTTFEGIGRVKFWFQMCLEICDLSKFCFFLLSLQWLLILSSESSIKTNLAVCLVSSVTHGFDVRWGSCSQQVRAAHLSKPKMNKMQVSFDNSSIFLSGFSDNPWYPLYK